MLSSSPSASLKRGGDAARHDKPAANVWRNYFSMLKKAGLPWVLMAVCFALSLISAVMALEMANQISVVLQEREEIATVIPEIWKLIAILAAGVVSAVGGAHLQGIVTAQVDRNMQRYAVNRIFYLKTRDLEAGDTREFITRLTDDTAKNSPFLIELAINEIPRLYYITAAIIAVAAMGQPALVGAMVLLIPAIIVLSFVSGRITYHNRNKIQSRLAAVTAKLAEKIDDIELIKSYGTEERETAAGGEVLDELKAVRKEGVLVDHINKFITNMLWFIDIAIMVVPPTLLMFHGSIDRAGYVAYILIVSKFETYVREHLRVWVALKEAQGATLRLSSVLNLESELTPGADTDIPAGDIVFENVSFAYGEDYVLENVSFTVEKGKKTGIVGLSGSGKSTVLNLMEKFYEPDEGRILLGGKDIRELDSLTYRSRFAYLPQNAPALSGSVREVLCGGGEHSDEALYEVLRDVTLYDDIMALGGLDAAVGHNGESLSGGQRQKLGIARLLLTDCDCVLLDEATSALDPAATAAVQATVDRHCQGKTLVVVAHDIDTVKNADNILMFDRGKLLGQGTHEELMRTLPLYAEAAKGGERYEAEAVLRA